MRRWSQRSGDDHVLSPAVVAVLVFVVLMRVMCVWLLCTLTFEDFPDWFEHTLPLGLAVDHVLHAIGAAFMVLLILDLRAARGAALNVRRGRMVGAALALLVLGGIHYWTHLMRETVDRLRHRAAPATSDELRTAPIALRFQVLDDSGATLLVRADDDGLSVSTYAPSRSERTEPLPAGALERLREALARTDYLAIEDDPALRLEDRGADSHYTMVIDVGERHHELTLLGAKHAGDGYRRGTPVAPEEAARRALSEVWGEVLGWSNETLGHRRIVTEALEPE